MEEMTEQAIREFWDAHPCGESQVERLSSDYEDFFRRYDRVEAEALATAGQETNADPAAASWPEEIQDVLGRIESLAHLTLHQPRPVAQGAIEVGDLVVLFRIVPKGAAPESPPKSEEPAGVPARPAKRRAGKGRKS